LVALAASLSACAVVTLAPEARGVQVLSGAPVGCEARGEVVVSVTHKVGFYERDSMRVRDELEVLARNEAPHLGANRISPLSPPRDGEQRWALWRCR